MKTTWRKVALTVLAVVAVGSGSAEAAPKTSFKDQVLPIVQAHCNMCHGASGVGSSAVGLDLTSWHQVRAGGRAGVIVIPYHPERSLLVRTVKDNWHSSDKNAIRMPPTGAQLSPQDIEVISRWIKEGAKNN